MPRTPARAIAPVAVALSMSMLAGCAEVSETDRLTDEMRSAVAPEWVFPAEPVGDGVTVVDGAAFAYVLDDERLVITSIDVRTGAELWRARTTTGAVATEVPGRPRVLWGKDREPLVAVMTPPSLAPGEGYGHRVELRDPRTGAVAHTSEAIWMFDPHDCRTADGICFTGFEENGESGVAMRLDPDSAAIEPFDDVLPGFGRYRHLAGSVYLAARGEEMVLVNLDDDDIDTGPRDAVEHARWEIPIEEVFGEGIVDAASGWLSSAVIAGEDDERTLLAWVAPLPEADAASVADVAEGLVVAVDLETGERLWDRTAARPCGDALVCTNEGAFTLNAAGESSGMVDYERDAGMLTMEGIDVRTGEVRWSLEIDAAASDDEGQHHPIDPGGFDALLDGGRVVLLDVETGVVRELDEGERLACRRAVSFRAHEYSNPYRELVDYRIGDVVESCTADGAVDEPLSRAAVRSAAADWSPEDDARRMLEDGPGDDDPMDEERRRAAERGEDEVRWRVLQTAAGIVGYRF